ncbi:hypothetical protein OEA41_009889 [Lepraria neglecta]|uniref:Altered inheritance of mitochondria protein 6 n=1 Tax=Lepraria neglecta TaxID=209136 RepID=A0AAE0DET1_9LECA|nr:hypothetical protein OEA41_009889 [Lepraria neglecta]
MGNFIRKPSKKEPSERIDRNLEEGRPSYSSSPETNSQIDSVKKPTLPKPKWRSPQRHFIESEDARRLPRVIRSGLQRCTRTCLGFFLAAFVVLFVRHFLGYQFAANRCRSVLLALLIYFNISLRRDIPRNDIQRIVATWGQPGSPTEGEAKFPTDFSRDITPIPCHSHNDYTRKVPLYDALAAGCTGVEADVWMTNNDLLVGHTEKSLSPSRTLQSLYIEPLLDILTHQNPQLLPSIGGQNSSNRTGDPSSRNGIFDVNVTIPLTLLIDVKTDGTSTFPLILQQLEPLRTAGWLTNWNGSTLVPGLITVVGTGNTPFQPLFNAANGTYRDIFFDAPLEQLWGESAPSNNKIYTSSNSNYASTDFNAAIGKVQYGLLSPDQVNTIRAQVAEATKRGLRARYWNTPAWPISVRDHVWDVLEKEGVGMLNVDDLIAAATRSWGG